MSEHAPVDPAPIEVTRPHVDQPAKSPQGSGGDPARSPGRRRLESGVIAVFRWTLRGLVLAAGLWLIGWLIGEFWSILLPVLLALLLSTVLWPPVRWMRKKLPAALAAIIGVLGLLAVVGGLLALITPVVAAEGQDLADQFSVGSNPCSPGCPVHRSTWATTPSAT